MKFIISFIYMDGEKFEVECAPGDMETFIGALGKNEVFFNDAAGIGIFIPIDKVRYFHVEKVDEQGRRIVASNSGVSDGNGGAESKEAQPAQAGEGSLDEIISATESESRGTGTDDETGGEG